jgi:hypothetical protein
MFQIFVRIPSGATLTFDVDTVDTGMDLKVQIFERIGIQPWLQWLSAGSHILEDRHRLSDRGVERETTVICNLRIGGGPCEICAQNTGGLDGRRGRTYLFFAPQ